MVEAAVARMAVRVRAENIAVARIFMISISPSALCTNHRRQAASSSSCPAWAGNSRSSRNCPLKGGTPYNTGPHPLAVALTSVATPRVVVQLGTPGRKEDADFRPSGQLTDCPHQYTRQNQMKSITGKELGLKREPG